MSQVRYSIEVTVEPLERPEGWVSVSVTPDRYSYGRHGVRGMFEASDDKAVEAFVLKAVPTMLAIEKMNAETEAAENAAAEADAEAVS